MTEAAIAVPPAANTMTLADWANLPEDEPGELVDGHIVEEEESDAPHEVVASWLVYSLGKWGHDHGAWVFGAGLKYALNPRRGRIPDLTVFLSRDRKLPRHGALSFPPDIAIEIISPTPRDGRRDRIEKLSEYASFGVRYYWLLDPRILTVEIFRLLESGRYELAQSASEGTIEVPGCEGLTLDIDAMWRRAADSVEPLPEEDPISGD